MTHAADPRTCLVAGAAGGLGSAIAARFLDDGWRVIGWDVAPILEPRIEATRVDITDRAGIAAAGASLPPLRAVVNSCGIASRTPSLELDPADFDRVEIPFPERGAPEHARAARADR